MHRIIVGTVLVVACVTVAASSSSASSAVLHAMFTEHFGGRRGDGPNCPTPGAFICGAGRDATFGALSEEVFLTGGSTYARVLTFADGSLTICAEFEDVQTPGNSVAQQPHPSYGNPTRIAASYEVCDGSGIFEGASGSGIEAFKIAGDEIRVANTGTLNLAD